MPDLRPFPALAARKPLASSRIRLSALPEGTILQMIAGPQTPGPVDGLERLAAKTGLALRAISPGQWLLVGDRPTPYPQACRLLAALEPHASGIDQSHGRVRLHLEGPMAATVLSKGTAVDLHPSAFAPGHTAATLVGHVSVHLTRLDAEAFEITVLRGFAEALWDDLALMCAEFL
ncbi:sarcosine oxidase subunit gamma [Shinella yambaruensis]|uniref:Sarcosine oxidase subunit gamma n=1 Tax=Shinella yambaruensis TaxID=415996 RepID=A0ABQ5ZFF9_9HYPH|nr:sarcosine oxidase subunit gamma family protein [Shinella yambaruensis]MCJ8029295.1 sarcosine oxidase subunit gamma [Shinella yambaruensis]MCU7983856.1 sarcosine oxidase subunit gamma [Shinella yambaruensis]GLR50582.1 sarcosine oxidase subunit gamma [Shinella yambaruensis]